ncbi:hypothetical protein EYF80_011032 [Liparis tanakae]|uniref:Uncharacterized protein n=1 Tax=Liparis tanakae TaxID=230148 RepID=A0A4Z2INQ6_9TELE|nr:hypothetical protein EYF80_011032 [Liparis tanakae]
MRQEWRDTEERLELENQVLVQKQQNHESSTEQLTDEIEILEEICLQFKGRTLGSFGRKMQDRDTELNKMKNKMVKQNKTKWKQVVVENQEEETASVIPAQGNIISLTETLEAQKLLWEKNAELERRKNEKKWFIFW